MKKYLTTAALALLMTTAAYAKGNDFTILGRVRFTGPPTISTNDRQLDVLGLVHYGEMARTVLSASCNSSGNPATKAVTTGARTSPNRTGASPAALKSR